MPSTDLTEKRPNCPLMAPEALLRSLRPLDVTSAHGRTPTRHWGRSAILTVYRGQTFDARFLRWQVSPQHSRLHLVSDVVAFVRPASVLIRSFALYHGHSDWYNTSTQIKLPSLQDHRDEQMPASAWPLIFRHGFYRLDMYYHLSAMGKGKEADHGPQSRKSAKKP